MLKSNWEHLDNFKAAVDEEVQGLFKRGTFKEVDRTDFTADEIENMLIIKAKLILSIKEPGTPEKRVKARVGAQAIGKKDRDQSMMMTYSPTVGRSSVRTMLSVAAGLNKDIFLRDLNQAYVPSKEKLVRRIYFIPPKELKCDEETLWLVLPLYGLPETGVRWYNTYSTHQHDTLGMTSCEINPVFCIVKANRENKKV